MVDAGLRLSKYWRQLMCQSPRCYVVNWANQSVTVQRPLSPDTFFRHTDSIISVILYDHLISVLYNIVVII